MINKGSFTFSNSLMTVFGAQLGQGSSVEPKTLPTKMVFLIVFLFAIFVITCFSAKMIAFLSFHKSNHPINSLEDVLKSEYSIGSIKGTALVDLFENSQEGTILNRILKEKIRQRY